MLGQFLGKQNQKKWVWTHLALQVKLKLTPQYKAKFCHCTENKQDTGEQKWAVQLLCPNCPSTYMMTKGQHFGLFTHITLVSYWRKKTQQQPRNRKILACHSMYKIFFKNKGNFMQRSAWLSKNIQKTILETNYKHLQNIKRRKSEHYLSRKRTC